MYRIVNMYFLIRIFNPKKKKRQLEHANMKRVLQICGKRLKQAQ